MHLPKRRTLPSTVSVSLVLLASELIGYVRDLVFVKYYGTTATSDAYIAASGVFSVPMMLLGACAMSTLVPIYLELRRADEAGADRAASNIIGVFGVLAVAASAALFFLAQPLSRLMNPGFDPQRLELTVELARIMLPSLALVIVAMVLSSLLEARNHFVAGQLSSFPRNITVIVAAVCFAQRYGIYPLAWSMFAAAALQVAVLVPATRKILRYRPCLDFRAEYIPRLFLIAVPSVLGMALGGVNQLISRAIASGLNVGDVTAMSCAFQLTTLVTGVLIVPITTVMFSRMSRCAADEDHCAIADIVLQCSEIIVLGLLPIIAVGAVFHGDVIRIAFGRGKFDERSIAVTAQIFLMYLLGMAGMGVQSLLSRAFHAYKDTRTPLYTTCVLVAVNVALNILLSRRMGVSGLALATSITGMLGAVLLFLLLRRKLSCMRALESLIELVKIGIAGALCALTALWMNFCLPAAGGTGPLLGRFALCAAASGLAYVLALVALEVRQLDFLVGKLMPRCRAALQSAAKN